MTVPGVKKKKKKKTCNLLPWMINHLLLSQTLDFIGTYCSLHVAKILVSHFSKSLCLFIYFYLLSVSLGAFGSRFSQVVVVFLCLVCAFKSINKMANCKNKLFHLWVFGQAFQIGRAHV